MVEKRSILFVGVFSTWYSNNHPQKHEFEKMGFFVDVFDYRLMAKKGRVYPLSHTINLLFWGLKLPLFPKFLRRLFYFEPGRRSMAKRLLQKARKKRYDLIFLSKIEEFPYWLLNELSARSPTYYYFMDPMKTARLVQAGEYAKRATFSSATFSDVTSLFNDVGGSAKQIVQGIAPEQFSRARKVRKKEYDVVFAGTIDMRRKKFLEYLRGQGITVTLYGEGTENGPVFNEDLMEIYAKARIVLNLSRTGKGFSVRVFEAMASGSLLLTQYCDDLKLFFKRGKHLDWFEDEQECAMIIKKYLSDNKSARAIGFAGKKLVFDKFTWHDQAKNMLHFAGLDD